MDSSRAVWLGVAFSFAFVALIWLTGELWLDPPPFAPRQEAAWFPIMWYHWQLEEPTFWTHASAWIGYALHQVIIWSLIWRAQRQGLKYTSGLHGINIAALITNAVFITLHLVQTQIWYDGLAQDVSEFTSQASVTLVLAGILMMENQRRGLAFGYKVPWVTTASRTLRKYHGYYFSWAILYTFWYHPMDITGGHLMGFLYMFFLMLQGSLFFTRAHLNRYWTIVAEVSVVAHAVTVAVVAGQGWPHFLTGFLGMFVICQMHGLGFSKRTRWVLGLAYIGIVLVVFSQTLGLQYSYQAGLIPAIEFALVAIISALFLLGMWLASLTRPANVADA